MWNNIVRPEELLCKSIPAHEALRGGVLITVLVPIHLRCVVEVDPCLLRSLANAPNILLFEAPPEPLQQHSGMEQEVAVRVSGSLQLHPIPPGGRGSGAGMLGK